MGPGKLLIAGYLSIDTVTDAAGRSRRMPGGACLYAGLGALHAGAEVALAASVGADYPDFWIEALALAGLDLAHLIRKNTLSRHADIRHFADGRRVSAHYRDPEWWVSSAEHAPEWPADLSGVGMLVAGPMPVSRLARLVEDARGQGVPVVADTSEAFARADPGGILQLVPALSVFAPSREETRLLYPGMGDEDAARRLSSMGPASMGPAVVQKLGADGLRVVTSGGRKILHLPALAAEVVDPTGAGDATVGALAAGLLAGLDIADAARVALEAGALAVSGEGPSALGIKFSNAAPQGAALELE
jgi:sugar/nucleoside kinase (ribokinase family)